MNMHDGQQALKRQERKAMLSAAERLLGRDPTEELAL